MHHPLRKLANKIRGLSLMVIEVKTFSVSQEDLLYNPLITQETIFTKKTFGKNTIPEISGSFQGSK